MEENIGPMSSKNWCKSKCIQLDFTIPHSPQLNGTAERMKLILGDKIRALLCEANWTVRCGKLQLIF